MLDSVQVIAPSRLHFGMFSFGQPSDRQFGGVGVMVDAPQTHVRLHRADRFEVQGLRTEQAYAFAHRVAKTWALAEVPRCCIEVVGAPRRHIGLGLGTQLGLSVAAGLNALLGRPALAADDLARSAGRGSRSAVGTHGFIHGGMVVDAGKADAAEIGPLADRVELPAAWRFVLMCPHTGTGLSGATEARAFAQLPPVPLETSRVLRQLALRHLVPAAAAARFDEFSANLYRYGCLAGRCFAAWQGGPFATPRLAHLVESIRAEGVDGVGQSSWGPTLFALLPEEKAARRFVDQFQRRPDANHLEFVIAAPNRGGAQVDVS